MVMDSIYAFISTLGICILFNIRKKYLFFTSLGGAVTWFFYLFTTAHSNSNIFAYFIASVIAGIYSETMARILKTPVTTFVICAIIPLVPGGGMYYTMLETIHGNITKALTLCLQTLSIAGAIAVGVILVSSLTKLIFMKSNKKLPSSVK